MVAVATAGSAAAQMNPTSCPARIGIVNSGFEEPTVTTGTFQLINANLVPGWSTTASDNLMEFWLSGFQGVPSFEGSQFVELNANEASTLFQDVATTPGQTIFWRLSHRGRSGDETMRLDIGPAGGAANFVRAFTDGTAMWGTYTGTYAVPAGQTNTRFAFEAVGGGSSGNFLDAIFFGTPPCLLVEKTVTPTGPVLAGAVLTYRITVTNGGGDAAASTALTDAIPANTTYVPGSLRVVSGPNAGAKTDAAGDDQAELDTANDRVVFRLGSGATGSTGGAVANGGPTTVEFQVRVNGVAAATTVTNGGATVSFQNLLASPPENLTSTSGAVSVAANPAADLGVAKTAAPSPAVAGAPLTYTVTVTNNGPSPVSGDVTVADTLPAALSFVSSPDGCTAMGQAVTCTLAGPTNLGSRTVSFVARGAATDSGTLANTVAVTSPITDPVAANDSASLTTPIVQQADLQVAKTGPAQVTAGTAVSYTVTVTNLGPSQAATVTVTDTLPAGLAFDAATSTAGCSAAGQVVTCPAAATLSVAAAAQVTIGALVDSAAPPGPVSNVAGAASAVTDPAPGNDSATVQTEIVASADVSATKAIVEPAVTPGTDFTYTIGVANAGPSTARDVVASDTLPADVTLVASPQGCAAAGQAVTCPAIAALAPGATADVTLTVRLAPGYTGTGTDRPNTATVASPTPDPAPANNTSQPVTPVVGPPVADVSIAKSVLETAVVPGTTFTYQLAVSNAGPSTAASISIGDLLPPQVTFVSSPDGCTAAGQSVTCPQVASLAPGAPALTRSVIVRLDPAYTGTGADAPNLATANATTSDPTPPNNTSPPATPPVIAPSADLSATKVILEPSVTPGTTLTYRVAVANAGPSTATAVVVSDTLPPQVSFVSSPDGCTAAGQTVTCPAIATIAPGATATRTIVGRLDAAYTGTGADQPNTATATSPVGDPVPANDTSPPVTPTVAPPLADVSIVKSIVEASVTPGDTFTYLLTASNAGPSAAVDVVVNDLLPAQVRFVSSPDGCTAAGASVTCPPFPLAPGASAPRTIVVRLDPAYTGSGADVLNIATVRSATSDPVASNDTSPPAVPAVDPPSADVSLAKTVVEPTVTAGEVFTYRLAAANAGPSTAVDVAVADTLPPQVTFVASPDGCTAVGQAVTCQPRTIQPGASAVLTLSVRLAPDYPGDGTDQPNTATATSPTPDPDAGNNTGGPVTPVVAPPSADVSLTKTVLEPFVTPGDLLTYRLVASNAGPSVALAVVVSDLLPAPLTFVSSPDGCTAAGQTVTCPTVAVLDPGASARFDLRVRLNQAYAGTGADVPNLATVASPTGDPVPGNDTSSVTPVVGPPRAIFAIEKSSAPNPHVPGLPLTYTVTVTNDGPSLAAGAPLAEVIPAGLTGLGFTWTCTVTGGGACAPASGLADDHSDDPQVDLDGDGVPDPAETLLTIPAGETATFVLTGGMPPATTSATAILSNIALVTRAPGAGGACRPPSPPMAPGPLPCFATDVNRTSAEADLAITKAVTGPAGGVIPGGEVEFTLSVTNRGPSDAVDVAVNDTLPPQLAFAGSPDGCMPGATGIACPPIGTLPAGDTVTRRIVTRLDPAYLGTGADVRNVATVTSPLVEPDPTDNASTVTLAVRPPSADLSVSKAVIEPVVRNGEPFTYLITVANAGPSTATGVVVRDTLPAPVRFVSSPESCTAAGQVVTCPPLPSLAPGATATVTLGVALAPGYRGDGADLPNVASVTAATADPTPANDASAAVVPTVRRRVADLSVTKTVRDPGP